MYLSVMGDLKLTPEEEADLESARQQAGLYCLQCGRCVPQCPHGVIVPLYMRAFMYAYGYRNPGKAKKTIAEVSPQNPPCGKCASCNVSCVMQANKATAPAHNTGAVCRFRSRDHVFLRDHDMHGTST